MTFDVAPFIRKRGESPLRGIRACWDARAETEIARMAKLALLSVSDKHGLVEFATTLVRQHGYTLLSTGGTAKLSGIAEAAAKVFGVAAHLGETPTWVTENLRDPGYNTALGLLYYGVSAQNERAPTARRSSGFISNVKRLFASA